jgi:Tol biopolymer transport system component
MQAWRFMQRGSIGLAVLTLAACGASPSALPSAASDAPSASAEPSPESLVYPVEDGEAWIVFSAPSTDEGEGEPHDGVFLVRPDGTGLHRLVREIPGSELRATWSPDGAQVAYVQARQDGGTDGVGVWVVNADGSDPHLAWTCDGCLTMDYLDWAADGIYVGVTFNAPDPESPPETFDIWRIDPAQGTAGMLLRWEDRKSVEQPRVSPDGTEVVYIREDIYAEGSPWAIFRRNVDGGPERQLTDWSLNASYPDWSADGLISFNVNDLRLHHERPHHIYTMTAHGGDLQMLATHDVDDPSVEVEAAHARWTEDGSQMTYSLLAEGEAWIGIMNADGSDQRLIPGPVWGTFTELRPGS